MENHQHKSPELISNEQLPCFLDFEASSLEIDSYPIQVAWSLPNGQIKSRFIRPADGWDDWSLDSEEIHGIPRLLLFDVGVSPRQVAEEMNAELDGQPVFCDGGRWDRDWMETLFEAAGIRPEFFLEDFQELIDYELPELLASPNPLKREARWKRIADQARAQVAGRAHRADNDVQYLINFYRIVQHKKRARES